MSPQVTTAARPRPPNAMAQSAAPVRSSARINQSTGYCEGQCLNISILVRTINGRGQQGGGTRAHGGDRLHQSSVCASPEPSRAPLTHSTVGLKNSSTRLSLTGNHLSGTTSGTWAARDAPPGAPPRCYIVNSGGSRSARFIGFLARLITIQSASRLLRLRLSAGQRPPSRHRQSHPRSLERSARDRQGKRCDWPQ